MLVFLSRTKWANKNPFHLISSEGVAPLCKCHRIIKLMGKVLRKGYICKHKLVLYEIPKSAIVYWFVMKTYFFFFASSIISWHWDGTGSWNLSLWKTRLHLSCTVNAEAAEENMKQGDKASATMTFMMTSSNGNTFRVTGPLCGEFYGPGEFPAQRPVTWSFDVFFDLRLNKRLSKQPWGWWFETPPWSLWRQVNVMWPCSPRIFKSERYSNRFSSNKMLVIY